MNIDSIFVLEVLEIIPSILESLKIGSLRMTIYSMDEKEV